MNNNYDQISTVSIDISSPNVDNTLFDNILIVGPMPSVTKPNLPPAVGSYTSIEEVGKAGWSVQGENADPVGVASMIAFSQTPTPTKIYIAPIQKNVSGEGKTAVTVEEEPVITIQRAMETNGWYAVCPAGVSSDKYSAIADYIETTEKLFFYTELNSFSNNSIVLSVNKQYDRTIAIYGREKTSQPDEDVPANNKYLNVAFASCCLGYQSGTETFAFKQLKNVLPSSLSDTEIQAFKSSNICYFTSIGGKNITMIGKVLSGEWIDVIRFRDWLKNDMQARVTNLFIQNPKIKLTQSGIALIENQMLASLKQGQQIGGIAEDEYDSNGNTVYGYTVTVPEASSLSEIEKTDLFKESRGIKGFSFTARLSGAIHFVALEGKLSYTN